MLEGWHYPGWTVLLALAAYLAVRSRGRQLPVSDARLLDRFVGISGLLVLLSLAGGPSFFLVSGIGCFRAYGRAGLLALALWCVAAPVALHGLSQWFRSGRRRRLAFLGLLSLSLFEGYQATAWFPSERRMEIPAWVDWLAAQPSEVRLAAFSPARERPVDWWGYESLFFKTRHRHASLNGSDSLLFAADLKLLGATYEQMTPAGLRFVVSLGYDNLAFHREYLEANPWIRSSPWLDAYRHARTMGLLQGELIRSSVCLALRLKISLRPGRNRKAPSRFPPRAGSPAGSSSRATWWSVCRGRSGWSGPISAARRSAIRRGHAISTSLAPEFRPFASRPPMTEGDYRLVFLDDQRRAVHSRGYRVRGGLETILTRLTSGKDVDAGKLVTATVNRDGNTPTLILENKSPYYLQANTSRDQVYLKSAMCHAGSLRTSAGSLVLRVGTALKPAEGWRDHSLTSLTL